MADHVLTAQGYACRRKEEVRKKTEIETYRVMQTAFVDVTLSQVNFF